MVIVELFPARSNNQVWVLATLIRSVLKVKDTDQPRSQPLRHLTILYSPVRQCRLHSLRTTRNRASGTAYPSSDLRSHPEMPKMRYAANTKNVKLILRPSADAVNGTSTWTNTSDLTNAPSPDARSYKVLRTLEVCCAINVRCTRRMAPPKLHSSVLYSTAIVIRVQASLGEKISTSTCADAMCLNQHSKANNLLPCLPLPHRRQLL